MDVYIHTHTQHRPIGAAKGRKSEKAREGKTEVERDGDQKKGVYI